MDSALKNHEDIICEELGRKICRKKKIHFEVSVDPFIQKAFYRWYMGEFSVLGERSQKKLKKYVGSGTKAIAKLLKIDGR